MPEETYDQERKGVAREMFSLFDCRSGWGGTGAIVSRDERQTFRVVTSQYLPPN